MLEVVWGFDWYRQTLVGDIAASPLFSPLVFYPGGWHTATLAHTPFLFLLAQPIQALGGPAFAYNAVALFSLLTCYLGIWILRKRRVPGYIALVGSLVYTFASYRWWRILPRHLHIAWLTSLLPWLAWSLGRAFCGGRPDRRYILLSGLIWGLTANLSLYGVFLGGLVLLVLGGELLRLRTLKYLAFVVVIAIAVGSLALVPYVIGRAQDNPTSFAAEDLLHWGASLNSLAIPWNGHPISQIQEIARDVYRGDYDESGTANLGAVTVFLALWGVPSVARRGRLRCDKYVPMTLAGLLLALGLFVKWDGEVVATSAFRCVNDLVWNVGHRLKPTVFTTVPAADHRDWIPLPGYLLTAPVPYFEAGRVMSRYSVVAYLGLVVLACRGLHRMPWLTWRALFVMLWLVEGLPFVMPARPLPQVGHPAYEWLASQPGLSTGAVADVVCSTLHFTPEILFGTLYHRRPIVSGYGSTMPTHTFSLYEYLQDYWDVWSRRGISDLLNLYGVQYVAVHVRNA